MSCRNLTFSGSLKKFPTKWNRTHFLYFSTEWCFIYWDIDECTDINYSHGCDENATCQNEIGSLNTCNCTSGYFGNGKICTCIILFLLNFLWALGISWANNIPYVYKIRIYKHVYNLQSNQKIEKHMVCWKHILQIYANIRILVLVDSHFPRVPVYVPIFKYNCIF